MLAVKRVGALVVLLATVGCSSLREDCQSDLQRFATVCAASFDGTEENVPACPPDAHGQIIVSCGDLNVIGYASAGSWECIYDSATHQLVGGRYSTDVPTSCPGGFVTVAGRLPAPACSSQPILSLPCSDSSSDGGTD